MDFIEVENKGKQILERFPVVKRFAKRLYQFVGYITSNKKLVSEGNIIRITPDDKYEYFYGYYDKSPWDADDRYMIALRVNQTYKSVSPREPGMLVLIDTANQNKIKEIGWVNAWNVQQGCMAQWLGPDFKSRIIYNDFRDKKYCSVIYNIEKCQEEMVMPLPVYDVAKDGSFALSLDFSRLHRMRPGYGYYNLPDRTKRDLCPNKTCIWKMEIPSGKVTELFRYTDMAKFEPSKSMQRAEHKVNHLMISPNGKRFMVLHRWFQKGRKYTRLVTVNVDKTEMYNLSDDVFVSHCYWKNDEEILSFLRKKKAGNHYYLMKDKTQIYKLLWPELKTDGHCSYSPDSSLVITDTYPSRERLSSVYLCEEINNKSKRIARVFAPFKYDNDCRCDLHPRWNRKGDMICIDSVHDKKRGVYTIAIPKSNELQKKYTVTVLLATYNGEKYLRDQLDSIIGQIGVSVSILVRDDGSKDNTINILNEYKEKGYLNWYADEHLGVQKGYLDLLKNASKAEFYAFCDQDDVWDKDKLLCAVTRLIEMRKDKPLIYYCGQRLVDENSSLISIHRISSNRNSHANFLISNIAGCTAVFNQCLVDAVNSANPKFILMHDSWVFKVCLALGGSYYADSEPHINYRQHTNNVTGIYGGLTGKFYQAKRYINVFKIQKQMESLYSCYKDQMIPEYRKLTYDICNYNKSMKNKIRILKRRDLVFEKVSLNGIVKLKILLGRL